MVDYRKPIIIIGAGRSGSTLLAGILEHHPDISFFSENHFMVPFIWRTIFQKHDLVMACLNAWKKPAGMNNKEFREQEIERISALIAKFAADVMRVNPRSLHWGYKEIWNGSKGFHTVEWDIYDKVFPKAHWLHVVRNPFTFAPSSAGFSNVTFTREMLINQLHDWVRMHVYNRKRVSTGRYKMVRYEDICETPKEILKPCLEEMGIRWNETCLRALKKRYVPSKYNPLEGSDVFSDPVVVPGLFQLVHELGYAKRVAELGVELIDDKTSPDDAVSFK